MLGARSLAAEAIQGAALALERVHHVEGGDGLAASVLGVGHGIADDVLQEHLEDPAGLLVDEARDALDTAAASQAANGGLRDALRIADQSQNSPRSRRAGSYDVEISNSIEESNDVCKRASTLLLLRNE